MSEIDELRAEVTALKHAVAILFAWQNRVTEGPPGERQQGSASAADSPELLAASSELDLSDDARKTLREIAALAVMLDES